MKRFFISAVLCMAFLTLQVFAYNPPNLTVENGNSVLETFITSTMDDTSKERVRSFLASELGLVLYIPSSDRYLLLEVKSPDSIFVDTLSPNGLANLVFTDGALGVVFDVSGPNMTFAALTTFGLNSFQKDCVIVSGRYFDSCTMNFPTPTSPYVADFEGSLFFRDDGGLMSDIKEEPDDGGGILGFLKGFWDALKDAFIGLFVPSEGFFADYFEDIRAVASVKMGGLLSLYNALLGAFQSLNGDTPSMTFQIPANSMFPYSPLVTFDVLGHVRSYVEWVKGFLTGCVVLFTAVVCYRRLVTLFEQ
ncbi:hypothetical protein ACS3UN_07985 [Oscillospiraceae bacterium LTW-04]|nr:hypothetical protein RBH76_02360 [Oscillospiraceae bacterium MB24-C1]